MKPNTKRKEMSLWQVRELFLIDQKAKGSSKATIVVYHRVFVNLAKWLAFETAADEKEFRKILKNFDVAEYGHTLPYSYLDMENALYHLRVYAEDICNWSEYTTYMFLRQYRTIMYYCMDKGLFPEKKIDVKKVEMPIKNVYTKAELEKLLVKPNPEKFVEYRTWVIINHILATGNRLGSIIDIRLKDLDFEEDSIIINTVKNKKPMRVPMIKKYKLILLEYINYYRSDEKGNMLGGDEFLFCNRFGEQMANNTLITSVREYNQRRGVFKTSIHLLRHSYAKNWIVDGGDIFTLKRNLGHSTLYMVEHYSNLYGRDLLNASEKHSTLVKHKKRSGRSIQIRK